MSDPTSFPVRGAGHDFELLGHFLHEDTEEFGVNSIIIGRENQWFFRAHLV